MTHMYERDLPQNAANHAPLSPLSFLQRSAEVHPRTPPADTARTTCGSADGLAYQPRRSRIQVGGCATPAARNCAAGAIWHWH